MRALVLGLGRFGLPLARTLVRRGWEVVGVDLSEKAVDRARELLPLCVRVDAMDEDSLREVLGDGVDVALVAIGRSFEASVTAVAVLRDLGVKRIIARANYPREAKILKLVGADQTIEIETEMGERMGRGLMASGLLDFLPLDEGAALVEWKAPANLSGRSLRETNLRQAFGVTVVALRAAKKERWEFVPDPDRRIQEGDVLMLVGPEDKIEKLTSE